MLTYVAKQLKEDKEDKEDLINGIIILHYNEVTQIIWNLQDIGITLMLILLKIISTILKCNKY